MNDASLQAPLVELRDITKSFGNVQALRGASIVLRRGEITAIVGDNGSGKSTLINILSGNLRQDSGMITIDGRSFPKLTPKLAMKAGISTVYQDLSLDDYRDVTANIFLGSELTKFGLLSRKKMRQKAFELIQMLEIGISDITLPVKTLSGGQRQAVAVARAVYRGGKLMIFDEPTAAMGVRESNAVLRIVKQMAQNGFAVLIICHNLHHVFSIADKICVMRHGKILEKIDKQSAALEEVQRLMIDADSAD